MSLDTVKELVKKIKMSNFLGDINICGFGEPFLHDNLLGVIKELRSGLINRISITTNGDCFNAKKVIALYEAGLDFIVVSCYDGEERIKEINNFFDFCSITSDKFFVRDLYLKEDLDSFALKNNFNNRSGTVKQFNNLRKCEGVCYLPFYYIVIDHNGEALLCVQDWFRRGGNFGNINKNTLEQIWNDVRLNEIRKNLKQGKRIDIPCNTCNVNGSLFGKESVDTLKI
jgi:radical SAM protein with 4Fe4S-binding SPASM domain